MSDLEFNVALTLFRSHSNVNKVHQARWLDLELRDVNKVVYVGVGVYVLDSPCTSPTCGQSL